MEKDNNTEKIVGLFFVKDDNGELHMFEKFDDADTYRCRNGLFNYAIREMIRQ